MLVRWQLHGNQALMRPDFRHVQAVMPLADMLTALQRADQLLRTLPVCSLFCEHSVVGREVGHERFRHQKRPAKCWSNRSKDGTAAEQRTSADDCDKSDP